jgi:ribonuclease D
MSIVTTQKKLDEVCAEIDEFRRFGMDLEFIPERTYDPELCLVQVATDKEAYIIDPLALRDLTSLWTRVADPEILIVLHAAEQDLDLVHSWSELIPQNIFDTQIAAGFVGYGYPVGYGKLLNQLLSVSIDKTESFTDWLNRPLTESQIHYALDDVRHLLPIYDKLAEMLRKDNRLHWVEEECQRYCNAEYYFVDRTMEFLRVKGASALSRRGLAVLRELCYFRDREAYRVNKPPRSILADNILLELGRRPPRKVEDIPRIRGVRPDQVRQYGSQIMEAVSSGVGLPDEECPVWPSSKTPPRREVLIGDILFAVQKTICYDLELAPELVASRNDLQNLIRLHRDGKVEYNKVALLEGWRRQIVGQTLIDLLDGAQMEMQVVKGDPPIRMLIDPSTKVQSKL